MSTRNRKGMDLEELRGHRGGKIYFHYKKKFIKILILTILFGVDTESHHELRSYMQSIPAGKRKVSLFLCTTIGQITHITARHWAQEQSPSTKTPHFSFAFCGLFVFFGHFFVLLGFFCLFVYFDFSLSFDTERELEVRQVRRWEGSGRSSERENTIKIYYMKN